MIRPLVKHFILVFPRLDDESLNNAKYAFSIMKRKEI